MWRRSRRCDRDSIGHRGGGDVAGARRRPRSRYRALSRAPISVMAVVMTSSPVPDQLRLRRAPPPRRTSMRSRRMPVARAVPRAPGPEALRARQRAGLMTSAGARAPPHRGCGRWRLDRWEAESGIRPPHLDHRVSSRIASADRARPRLPGSHVLPVPSVPLLDQAVHTRAPSPATALCEEHARSQCGVRYSPRGGQTGARPVGAR
jgi:hypothetical protein